ncbi:hypothetical protein FQN52_003131 [Onygenales sp. PD_12]|nr:hypothetical protein FQN52_003131 [Onygenales sp. PD_12]
MQLSDLPTEIILMIGEAQTSLNRPPFANDVASLNALAQTCRRFNQILTPYLYRFNARYQDSSALVWAVRNAMRRTAEIALDNKADVHVSLDDHGFPVNSKTRQPGLRYIATLYYRFYPPDKLNNIGLLTQAFMRLPIGLMEAVEYCTGESVPCADTVANYDRVIELLIDRGIDIERADVLYRRMDRVSFGLTALHRAAYAGYESLVQLLLEKGANVDATVGFTNYTPLFFAVRTDGGNRNKWRRDDPWKLQWAPRKQRVVRMLLEHGADVNARTDFGNTPLHYAVYCPIIVRILLEYGADVTESDKDGGTPLHFAVYHLPYGPSFLACDGRYRRDICAIKSTIRMLLEHGANIDARDRHGATPLHFASRFPEVEAAQILLECGADVHAVGEDGGSAIHYALDASQGKGTGRPRADGRAIFRMLIEFGANINRPANNGVAPLHRAAAYGDLEMVGVLIEHGAAVQARDDYGFSPLRYAVEGLNGTLCKYAHRFSFISGFDASVKSRFAVPCYYEGVVRFLSLYQRSRLLTQ